jgi:hypothetical protein
MVQEHSEETFFCAGNFFESRRHQDQGQRREESKALEGEVREAESIKGPTEWGQE